MIGFGVSATFVRMQRLDWLHRIPKVELHLHLEGAIPHDTLWELVSKYGGDPAKSTVIDLAKYIDEGKSDMNSIKETILSRFNIGHDD